MFSVIKKKIGDTEYGVGWLPLGGYVKISGMIDESMDKNLLRYLTVKVKKFDLDTNYFIKNDEFDKKKFEKGNN